VTRNLYALTAVYTASILLSISRPWNCARSLYNAHSTTVAASDMLWRRVTNNTDHLTDRSLWYVLCHEHSWLVLTKPTVAEILSAVQASTLIEACRLTHTHFTLNVRIYNRYKLTYICSKSDKKTDDTPTKLSKYDLIVAGCLQMLLVTFQLEYCEGLNFRNHITWHLLRINACSCYNITHPWGTVSLHIKPQNGLPMHARDVSVVTKKCIK